MPGAPESLRSLMDTVLQGPQPDAGPVGDGEPAVRRQRADLLDRPADRGRLHLVEHAQRRTGAPCRVVQAVHRPVDNYGTHKTEPVRK